MCHPKKLTPGEQKIGKQNVRTSTRHEPRDPLPSRTRAQRPGVKNRRPPRSPFHMATTLFSLLRANPRPRAGVSPLHAPDARGGRGDAAPGANRSPRRTGSAPGLPTPPAPPPPPPAAGSSSLAAASGLPAAAAPKGVAASGGTGPTSMPPGETAASSGTKRPRRRPGSGVVSAPAPAAPSGSGGAAADAVSSSSSASASACPTPHRDSRQPSASPA